MKTRPLASEEEGKNVFDIDVLSDDERIVASIMDELAGTEGAQIRVYRDQKGRPMQYLFQAQAGDDVLGDVMGTLQEHYGAGEYRIQARAPGGVLKMNRLISVGAAPKKPDTAQPARDTGAEMINMQMQMMQQSKSDMLQMFAMMQQSQTSMIQALAAREQPAPREGLSLSDVMVLLPALSKNDGNALDTLLKGIELGKSMEGNVGGASMTDLAQSALQMISTAQATRPVPVPQPAPLPYQRPAQVPSQGQGHGDAALDSLVLELINAAARGRDPMLYAEIVIDELGEQAAVQLARNPGALDMLSSEYPVMLNHRAWFDTLLAAIGLFDEGGESDTIGQHGTDESAHGETAGTVQGDNSGH